MSGVRTKMSGPLTSREMPNQMANKNTTTDGTSVQAQRFIWNDELLDAAADAIAIYTKHSRGLETLRTTTLFGIQAITQSDQRHVIRLLQQKPPKWWRGNIAVYISLKRHELRLLQETRELLRNLGDRKYSNGDVVALSLLAIGHPLLRLPLPCQQKIIE